MGTQLDAYNRLNEIWSDWGLPIEPGHTEVHKKVLGQISEWLEGAQSSAERVVRAAQALLINPERPDGRKRIALTDVLDLLRQNWAGFGSGEKDLMFLQAMLLAAWPEEQIKGEFRLIQLLDSAWDVMMGRQKQQQRLAAWRRNSFHMEPMRVAPLKPPTRLVPVHVSVAPLKIDQPDIHAHISTLTMNLATGWNLNGLAPSLVPILRHYSMCIFMLPQVTDRKFMSRLEPDLQHLGTGQNVTFNQFSGQLIRVLEQLSTTIIELNSMLSMVAPPASGLEKFTQQIISLKDKKDEQITYDKYSRELLGVLEYIKDSFQHFIVLNPIDQALAGFRNNSETSTQQTIAGIRSDQELFFWGQARYCHHLRKPYRRIISQDEALWWTAFEAAERSLGTAVEPAAAFLVETLNALGQDIQETRSLKEWIDSSLKVISEAGSKVPSVGNRLRNLVSRDAIGLPVTLMRLNPSSHQNIDVALPLEEKIDRGQWATWIFREIVLDQCLGDSP